MILFSLSLITIALIEKFSSKSILDRFGLFRITEIEIETQWPLEKSEVKTWLSKYKKENLFRLNGKTMSEQIQDRPWVDKVILRKQYPNKLFLKVVPKKAVAVQIEGTRSYYLDLRGDKITSVSKGPRKGISLPILRAGSQSPDRLHWATQDAVNILEGLNRSLSPWFHISEFSLELFPYFRIYTVTPHVEVTLSAANWQTQLPYLLSLLHQIQRKEEKRTRINLVFSKKAIVSPPLSN